MKKAVSIFLVLVAAVSILPAQQLSSGLSTQPRFYIPVGAKSEYFNVGIGAGVEGLFSFGNVDFLAAGVEVGYNFTPLPLAGQSYFSTDANVSMLNFGLLLRAGLPLGDRISLYGKIGLGGYAGFLHGSASDSGFGFSYSAGAGMGILFNSTLGMHVGADFVSNVGVYDAIAINIALNTRFSGPGSVILPRKDFINARPGALPGGGNIEFLDTSLTKIFPVLYKFYADHPIGSTRVVNTGKKTLTNVEIRFQTAQFMDNPLLSARIETLAPGEEQVVDLYALFSEDILGITEEAKLVAELKADYVVDDSQGFDGITQPMDTWHRNAMTWENDEKIATFVTAGDEEIQKVARNAASIVRDEGLDSFNREFQQAMVMFNVMDVFDCVYVVDASSAYSELSKDTLAIDSVQFPRQTLQYRAGDCDDLSSTYNALLEALGVETAFITVPGHIYSAFKLSMSRPEAEKTFSRSRDLVFAEDGSVWVPIETTALKQGFLAAWSLGARQWQEHSSGDAAALIPVRRAWEVYKPVAFGVSSYELEIPDRTELAFVFSDELESFIDQEIASRERGLVARLKKNPDDKKTLNSLGALYARFGRFDEAGDLFESAVPEPSALVNLGNLAILTEEMEKAEDFYYQALEERSDHPAALYGLARISEMAGEEQEHSERVDALAEVSPELAARLNPPVLEGTARADAAAFSSVLWDEE